MMAEIQINGWAYPIEEGWTINDLIHALTLQDALLSVAVNGERVRRDTWSQHALQAADSVDIVQSADKESR